MAKSLKQLYQLNMSANGASDAGANSSNPQKFKNSDQPSFAEGAKPGKSSNGQKGWIDKKGNFITKGDKPGEWHVQPNRNTRKPLWKNKAGNMEKPRFKSGQPYWNVGDDGLITH